MKNETVGKEVEPNEGLTVPIKRHTPIIHKKHKTVEKRPRKPWHKKRHDSVMDDFLAYVYVDGSYNVETERYGWAVVGQYRPDKIKRSSSFEDSPYLKPLRNVAGETRAARKAIEIAKKNSKKELIIYYDYVGVAAWVTGEWQAKNDVTRKYRDYMRNSKISITFVKVKAHSNDPLNDEADYWAKRAVHLAERRPKPEKYPTHRDYLDAQREIAFQYAREEKERRDAREDMEPNVYEIDGITYYDYCERPYPKKVWVSNTETLDDLDVMDEIASDF